MRGENNLLIFARFLNAHEYDVDRSRPSPARSDLRPIVKRFEKLRACEATHTVCLPRHSFRAAEPLSATGRALGSALALRLCCKGPLQIPVNPLAIQNPSVNQRL